MLKIGMVISKRPALSSLIIYLLLKRKVYSGKIVNKCGYQYSNVYGPKYNAKINSSRKMCIITATVNMRAISSELQ